MNEQLQAQAVNIRELKEYALKLPEPIRSLILSSKDEMGEQEFLIKFFEWKKLLQMQREMQ